MELYIYQSKTLNVNSSININLKPKAKIYRRWREVVPRRSCDTLNEGKKKKNNCQGKRMIFLPSGEISEG